MQMTGGWHVMQCFSDRQAPTEWLLDWIKTSTRNGFALFAIAVAVQSVSFWLNDPTHTNVPAGLLAGGAVFALGVAAILTRPHPRRIALIVTTATLAIMATFSPVVVLYTEDFLHRGRSHAIDMYLWKAAPTVLGLPLPSTAALILLSLATDIVSWELCHHYYNDPRSLRIHISSALCAAVWLGLAVLSSGRLRSIFDAQRALAVEKDLLVSMISMMCDASVYLSHDCRTILSSDHRFKIILGRDMTGEDVCDALAEDERQRLKDSLPGATSAPLLLPTTLITERGCKIRVELFIVGNRDADAGGQAGRVPAFLIGVRVGEHHASSESEEPVRAPMGHQQLESVPLALKEEAVPASEALSAPETTLTGRVFARLDDRRREEPLEDEPGDLQQRLESVLALGEKEQWLLAPTDLRIAAHRIIGTGSYGVVVTGWLHGSPVAVKVTKHSADKAGVRHLVSVANEIRILRHVRHPNVVTFHGACVEPREGELAMVLERVLGDNLGHYVHSHSLDSEVCRRFQLLLDVACALRYLHALRPQVLHGDLKGRNIIVEPAIPRAKLLDFGLSRLLTKKAKPLGGSLAWVAPEIICKNARRPSPSADVFSLGRVACLIITCKNPLERLGTNAIVDMAKRGVTHMTLWEEGRPLHQESMDLCERLLSYAPEDRPTAYQAHREISAWAPPDTGGETLARELARAEHTDTSDLAAGSSCEASPFKALRSALVEMEQRRKRSHAGRAHRGAARAVDAAPATVHDEGERRDAAAHSSAPRGVALCSL